MTEPTSPSPLSESQLAERARELRDLGRCPACLTPLDSLVCASCGLNLDDPLAHELAAASAAAAAALESRAALIARMRAGAVAAASAPAAASPVAAPPAAAAPAVAAPAVAAPPAAPAASAPRRSSVQIVLVIVGVSLLSTFAVFGLVYAFINYGVLARSLIVGGVTLAAIVTASLLRRRGLRATGEGIAAFGALLVLLDAWAIRENDFFGAGEVDGALYWGAALLTSAALFVVWSRLAGLRVPSVAGHALFVPAVFVLTIGVLDPLVDDGAVVALSASAAALAASALHRILLPSDRPEPGRPAAAERLLIGIASTLATPVGLIAAFFVSDDVDAAGLLALLGIAALLALKAVSFVSVPEARGSTRALGAIAAGGGTLALVLTPLPLAIRLDAPELAVSAPLLVAVAAALGVEALSSRLPRGVALSSLITAITLGGLAALFALLVALAPTLAAATLLADPGTEALTAIEAPDEVSVAGLAALTGAVALALAAWGLRGRLPARRVAIAVGIATVAVIAVPFVRIHAVVIGLWLLVAAVALVALWLRRARRTALDAVLSVTAVTATVLGYALAWTTPPVWIGASIATLVLLLGGRALLTGAVRVVPDLAALGVAATLGGAVVAEFALLDGADETIGIALAVGAVAAATLTKAAYLGERWIVDAERRALFIAGFATATIAAASAVALARLDTVTLPALPLAALAAGLVAASGLAWLVAPRTTAFRPERLASAALLAPALAAAVSPLAHAARLAPSIEALLIAAVPVLVAALGFAVSAAGRGAVRVSSDAGASAVALLALGIPVADGSIEPWIVLVPAAITALLVAISRDGLVESRSPRKHLGWLALVFAVAALWTRLADGEVETLEAYTLPLAGAVLAIALVIQWRAPRTNPQSAPPAVPYLVGAALLAALVPSALAVNVDEPVRTLVVGLAILAVLAIGALAGVESSLIGTRADRFVGYLVGIAALAAGLASLIARASEPLEPLALGAVIALAVVSLLIVWLPPAVGSAALSWTAFAVAAVGGLVLIVVDVADPLEWVTVPLAGVLLARGSIALRRTPTTRSWPRLGPGLAVLLVPSLLVAYLDDPVWRIVALGIVSVIVVMLGLALKLQAPFVLGALVLGWHLVTQFWHQLGLVYNAVPWWVWAGIAGVLVIVAAIRYEQSLKGVRGVARSIRQLR